MGIILQECRLCTLTFLPNSKIVNCMTIFVDFLTEVFGEPQKIVIFTGSRDLQ